METGQIRNKKVTAVIMPALANSGAAKDFLANPLLLYLDFQDLYLF